jgi:predicted aspartyl protease
MARAATVPNGCALKEYASLPVTYNREGLPEVQVSIQGQQVWMFVNTTSPVSALDTATAKALHLSIQALPSNIAPVHIAGQPVQSYARATSLLVGNLNYRNTQILLASLPQLTTQGAAGFLGIDALASPVVDLELDLGHDRINLFAPQHCPQSPVYWAQRYSAVPLRRGRLGAYFVVMELDGKKLETSLATGSESSMLHTDVSKRLYGFDQHSSEVQSIAGPGGSSRTYYRAMALSSGGLSVTNARVRLIPGPDCYANEPIGKDQYGAADYTQCLGAFPLQLGMSVLKKLRLYLSAGEGQLYFTVADAGDNTPVPSTRH